MSALGGADLEVLDLTYIFHTKGISNMFRSHLPYPYYRAYSLLEVRMRIKYLPCGGPQPILLDYYWLITIKRHALTTAKLANE